MGRLAPGQGSGEGSEEVLPRSTTSSTKEYKYYQGTQSTGWEETWPLQELTGGWCGQWVGSKAEGGGDALETEQGFPGPGLLSPEHTEKSSKVLRKAGMPSKLLLRGIMLASVQKAD